MDLKRCIMVQERFINKIGIIFLYILILELGSCSQISGMYPITGCLFLWDAGTPKERMIIFSNNTNYSGIPIIPSNTQYQKNTDVGVAEYVVNYLYDKDWILATTISQKDSVQHKWYWAVYLHGTISEKLDLISKNSYGPLSRKEFDSIAPFIDIPASTLATFTNL